MLYAELLPSLVNLVLFLKNELLNLQNNHKQNKYNGKPDRMVRIFGESLSHSLEKNGT